MKVLGLLGESLAHSLSPEIHEKLLKKLNIQGSYDLLEVKNAQLEDKLDDIAKKYDGINVTIPYKVDVIKKLDSLSEEAKAIGAVNTIVFSEKKGYNTDYFGFGKMLECKAVATKGKRVILLGAGGAARAVIKFFLDSDVLELIIVARNKKKAMHDLKSIITSKVKFRSFKELEEQRISGDIIVNSTPVGMYPRMGYSPVCEAVIKRFEVAVDLIYNPLETLFLKIARDNGLKTVNGLNMLVSQAAKSQEIWLGCTIDEKIISEIESELAEKFIEKMDKRKNIIIIGMPGAGKTVFGRRLAKHLDMKFCDADEYLEVTRNITIKSAFAKGEDYFRKIESECAKELSQAKNTVIATGGGIVTIENNMKYFQENSIIVFLDRKPENILEDLKTDNRPMLADNKERIFKIYESRINLYKKYANIVVENKGSVKKVLNNFIDIIKELI